MDRKVKSFRVRVDLLEWIESYAKSRGDTQIAVLEAALDSFRGLTRGGVPDLPEPDDESPAPKQAAVPKKIPGVTRARDLVPDVGMSSAELGRSRQAALNKRMGWS